jgi:hypothetical protein
MSNGTMASTSSDASTSPGRITLGSDFARRQLEDALALSAYAVSAGILSPAGDAFGFGDIAVIQGIAAKLGLFDPHAGGQSPLIASITPSEWNAFEQAYYRLAVFMSPVTAETLAATSGTGPVSEGPQGLRNRLLGYSPALRFTRGFALAAILVAVFVVTSECSLSVLGQEGDTGLFSWLRNILESLLPWAYGALGSCAYLLRSAHFFIYQRSFDLRRKPEYFNRVLLGAISGGAIILFVNYLVDDGGTVLHLSV